MKIHPILAILFTVIISIKSFNINPKLPKITENAMLLRPQNAINTAATLPDDLPDVSDIEMITTTQSDVIFSTLTVPLSLLAIVLVIFAFIPEGRIVIFLFLLTALASTISYYLNT